MFELEALPPDVLQELLRESIRSVIDVVAYNREIEAEKQEAARLGVLRGSVREHLVDSMDLSDSEGE